MTVGHPIYNLSFLSNIQKEKIMAHYEIPYSPRQWQLDLHNSLERFNVVVVHRGGGKTFFAINELIRQATKTSANNVVCAYLAPTYKQAKAVVWDLFKTFLGHVKGIEFNSADLKITFPSGAVIYVLGAENADNLRGLHLNYVVLDEVASMPANIWEQIIRPMLTQKKGGAIFIGTPAGLNLFHSLYVRGTKHLSWKSVKMTYKETGAIPDDELDILRMDYEGRPEVWAQEYECSFEAMLVGCYFAEQMTYLEDGGKIGDVPYDSSEPVFCGWDIGLDGTAIWYAQIVGSSINIIDFDFTVGSDIKTALNIINSKPYIYSVHYIPHDAVKTSAADQNKEFSVEGRIKAAGYKTHVVKKETVANKILATKAFLPRCRFDINNTNVKHPRKDTYMGLTSLRLYRAKVDAQTGLDVDKPLHDEHSHPADALAYLALGTMSGNKDYKTTFHSNKYGGGRRKVKVNTKCDRLGWR